MAELDEIDRVVVVLVEGPEEFARLLRAELHTKHLQRALKLLYVDLAVVGRVELMKDGEHVCGTQPPCQQQLLHLAHHVLGLLVLPDLGEGAADDGDGHCHEENASDDGEGGDAHAQPRRRRAVAVAHRREGDQHEPRALGYVVEVLLHRAAFLRVVQHAREQHDRDTQEEERRHEGIDRSVQGLDQDLRPLVVPCQLEQAQQPRQPQRVEQRRGLILLTLRRQLVGDVDDERHDREEVDPHVRVGEQGPEGVDPEEAHGELDAEYHRAAYLDPPE
mmetsp:Transcript_72366/g.174686  ORF Transcript_72366/g.174686 Transcript_72366/m.174686 type:complete len:276 (+) Transcript_72366:221-1048(+)